MQARPRFGPLALAALLSASLLPACAPRTTVTGPRVSAVPRSSPASASPAEAIARRTMPYAKRKASMPSGMPIEVPVIDGSVIGTSAPVSEWTWIYTLETSGTVASVGEWYRRAYVNASWRVVEQTPAEDELTVSLEKGGAQTVLRLRPVGVGRVEVRASIGVGRRAPTTD